MLIWLSLIALLAFDIHAAHNSHSSFRNRRQHITQQQQNPPSYGSSYSFNQIISRQQPADLDSLQQFLLRNNITIGVNAQHYYESGNWGEWSEPSPCTRQCGGGVSSQTRICLDKYVLIISNKFFF